MNNKYIKTAFFDSLPVLAAYLPLGMVWGLLWEQAGLPPLWGFLYSTTIYAGAVQFLALSFINAGGPLLGMLMTVLPVAMRNSFYTVALIDRLPEKWVNRCIVAYGMVDASFAILVSKEKEQAQNSWYCIPLAFFIQAYWVAGTSIGIFVGSYVPDGLASLDFALPALLVTLVVGQQERLRSWKQILLAAVVAGSMGLVFGHAWLMPAIVACSFLSLRAWS